MKRTCRDAFFLVCAALVAGAAQAKDLDLVSSYELSADPLTTEKTWKLDPQEPNPHRQRWVLQRQVRLQGLEARKLGKQFGVQASALESKAHGFVRGEGPWYRPLTDFPCGESIPFRVEEAFGTAEGARKAVDAAGVQWRELLKKDLGTLSLRFERVKAASEEAALRQGLVVFERWLKNVEQDWESAKAQVRKTEWSFYSQQAKAQGVCAKQAKAKSEELREPNWESMMEPPSETPPQKPLARAPARRWNGLYSVRLSVEVGAQILSGQFLLDSSAPRSLLSPSWLESQGVLRAWVAVPGSEPERATWSVAAHGGVTSALASVASVDRVKLSGYELDLKEFLVQDVDFFGPPENVGSCCDGILGADFFRRHVVEIDGGKAPGIRIWPKEGFRPAKEGSFWAEARLARNTGPRSSCLIRSESDPFSSGGAPRFEGILWNTGNVEAMLTREGSLSKLVRSRPSIRWSVECGSHVVAREVKIDAPATAPAGPGRAADLAAGMPLLSRGSFVFDLPHGRVWFQKDAMEAEIPANHSGLTVKYRMEKGDRVLVVQKIEPKSPAEALAKAGLRAGMRIEEIDSRPAEELDQWDVDQRLAGVNGDTVTLKWGSKKATKVAPLKLTKTNEREESK